MTRPTVFIDGEAGTTGLEIRARLAERTDIAFVSIDPAKRKDEAERRRLLNGVDLVVLCLPDEAAKQAIAMIDNPSVRVLDASSAHRVERGWTYGFPELLPGQADRIRAAHRLSNPGCYPTGALALIRPLVDAGLVPADHPICINATSGYSGGGRQMIDAFEGRGPNPIADRWRIYALGLAHKHVPETTLYGGLAHRPVFSPAVGCYRQGMIVEVPLALWALPKRPSGRDLHAILAERFDGERFVRVMPFDQPPDILAPEGLNGSNLLELYVFADRSGEQALLVARLDNLGKGASGAAVQNLDLMLGLAGEHSYALVG
jgi:N-acetyl-gamma-glutamyl-phosphate reductase